MIANTQIQLIKHEAELVKRERDLCRMIVETKENEDKIQQLEAEKIESSSRSSDKR